MWLLCPFPFVPSAYIQHQLGPGLDYASTECNPVVGYLLTDRVTLGRGHEQTYLLELNGAELV